MKRKPRFTPDEVELISRSLAMYQRMTDAHRTNPHSFDARVLTIHTKVNELKYNA